MSPSFYPSTYPWLQDYIFDYASFYNSSLILNLPCHPFFLYPWYSLIFFHHSFYPGLELKLGFDTLFLNTLVPPSTVYSLISHFSALALCSPSLSPPTSPSFHPSTHIWLSELWLAPDITSLILPPNFLNLSTPPYFIRPSFSPSFHHVTWPHFVEKREASLDSELCPLYSNCNVLPKRLRFALEVKCLWGCVCVFCMHPSICPPTDPCTVTNSWFFLSTTPHP